MEPRQIYCQELCTALQVVLQSMAEAERCDYATDYAVLFSKSCLVTYSIKNQQPMFVKFHVYSNNGISIYIDTQAQSIIGYVNAQQIIALPLSADLIRDMTETVFHYTEFLLERKQLQIVVQDDNTYTFDINA